MTDLSLSFFLFAFLLFIGFSLTKTSESSAVRMLPVDFSLAGIIFSIALSIDFGVKAPFVMAGSRALALHLIIPFISGLMGALGGLSLGERRMPRSIGSFIMEAFLIFLLYSFEHTEIFFPWSNAVSYAIYVVWIVAALILIIIPARKD